MQLHVFAVWDAKAGAYLPPFFSATPGVAERDFTSVCRTADHPFHKFPEDYTLVYLGLFAPDTGKFDLVTIPEFRLPAVRAKGVPA